MTLADKVIRILSDLPNRKAADIVIELGRRCNGDYDKATVNSLLYGELKHKVVKDSEFRWSLLKGVDLALSSTDHIEEGVSFRQLLHSDTPYQMITSDLWEAWTAQLKSSDVRHQKIQEVADELDLYLPSFFAHKTISDYLAFQLSDILEMKNVWLQKVIFLCLARRAFDLAGSSLGRITHATSERAPNVTGFFERIRLKNLEQVKGIQASDDAKEICGLATEPNYNKHDSRDDTNMDKLDQASMIQVMPEISIRPKSGKQSSLEESPNQVVAGSGHVVSAVFTSVVTEPSSTDYVGSISRLDKANKLSDEDIIKILASSDTDDSSTDDGSNDYLEGGVADSAPLGDQGSSLCCPVKQGSNATSNIEERIVLVQTVDSSAGEVGRAIYARPELLQSPDAAQKINGSKCFDAITNNAADSICTDKAWVTSSGKIDLPLKEPVNTENSLAPEYFEKCDEEQGVDTTPANEVADERALVQPGLAFVGAENNSNSALISWDMIPNESVLERTPRELFEIPPQYEESLSLWLERIQFENIDVATTAKKFYLFQSLDLLSMASCSVSWLLAHWGEELIVILFDVLTQIIFKCTGSKACIRTELFSNAPFVSEQLLFYLIELHPPCTNALMITVRRECQDDELMTSISEASIFERRGFTAATIQNVALFYTLTRQNNKAVQDTFNSPLSPREYGSFADYIGAWLGAHLKKAESLISLMYEGWVGPSVKAIEIARQIECTTQNVYRIINIGNKKLSTDKSVADLHEFAMGVSSELYKAGGIFPSSDIGAVLKERYGWSDMPSAEGVARILERAKVRGIVFKNDWVALTTRACLSDAAKTNEKWSNYNQGLAPGMVSRLGEQPAEIDIVAAETSVSHQHDTTHELQQLLLPDEEGDAVILPEWVTNERFTWLAAGAILLRADQLRLRAPNKVWSVAELQLSAQDYSSLREWGSTGEFLSRNLSMQVRAGSYSFSGREALALLFIVYAAEVGRREATEGELWPTLYESLGSGLKDFLLMNITFGNVSPRPWLKSEMVRTFREYHLRHAFDGAGTQAWVKSIYLQFGFTLKGLNRLPWWLCGQQIPVAVQELLVKGPNQSESFVQLWQSIKEFRWKGIHADEFQQSLKASPWLPATSIDSMTRAALSKSHLAVPDKNSDVVEGNESTSILGLPRLSISEGKPVFLVPLGDVWPDSLQEASYVLALDSFIRVLVERQSDGSYSLSTGEIAVDPVKSSLDVMLFSGGRQVWEDPIRYDLWNVQEEFSFYKANGCKVSEARVKADGMPLYILSSSDIGVSSVADNAYSLFNGDALLHYFKRGIPGGFTLSLDDEPFWKVVEPVTSARTVNTSQPLIQAFCTPLACKWGDKAKIRISGIPSGLIPRRLIVGEMRLQVINTRGLTVETEQFTVTPGMISLPNRGTLIGLLQGDLCRCSVSITSKFSGVALETAAGWVVPKSRRLLDKAELQTSRILALPPDSLLNDWAYTEGKRLLARPSLYGDRIGQELIGLGAPLCFRRGPLNSVETPIEISRAVIDGGVFEGAERLDRGWRIGLRHELDISDEFALHAWFPDESLPIILKRSEWRHDCATRSIFLVPEPAYLDAPSSIAISFAGKCIGRAWCGRAAFNDFAKIVWNTPTWKETASMLAWWHAPLLIKEISDAVAERVRSQAADTLIAWMGISEGNVSPNCMTDVTFRMKDAIRAFFHDSLPESDKSTDVLRSLELLSGDWDLDEDEAWKGYDNLLEISPIVLVHLAKAGTTAFYGSKPDRAKWLLKLLRLRIAGLSDNDPESEIALVEKNLLASASRVMGVDEQFLNRSVLEEARKLLKSERPIVRNLEYCLDILPVRDWIALRLLA